MKRRECKERFIELRHLLKGQRDRLRGLENPESVVRYCEYLREQARVFAMRADEIEQRLHEEQPLIPKISARCAVMAECLRILGWLYRHKEHCERVNFRDVRIVAHNNVVQGLKRVLKEKDDDVS